MTLDFECHSKDMDDKSANLMETARTLFGEIWSYVPNVENVPDEIQQKFVFIGIDKAVMALQIISGENSRDCSEAVHIVYEQLQNAAVLQGLEDQFKDKEQEKNV